MKGLVVNMANIDQLNIYLRVLEEIRIQNKVSLNRFIDNIVSERSYRRYLSNEETIPIDILDKLMRKEHITFIDIVIYVFTNKMIPSGIVEFMNHLYKHEFQQMEKYYTRLKTYDRDTIELNTYVSLLVKKYEFNIDASKKTIYEQALLDQKAFFLSKGLDHNTTMAFLALYLEQFGEIESELKPKFLARFLDPEFYYQDLYFYYYSLSITLESYIKTNNLDDEDFLKLCEFSQAIGYAYFDMLYQGEGDFFYSIFAKKKQGIKDWEEPLFRYLMNQKLLWKQDILSERNKFISSFFEIEIDHFINERVHNIFNN